MSHHIPTYLRGPHVQAPTTTVPGPRTPVADRLAGSVPPREGPASGHSRPAPDLPPRLPAGRDQARAPVRRAREDPVTSYRVRADPTPPRTEWPAAGAWRMGRAGYQRARLAQQLLRTP